MGGREMKRKRIYISIPISGHDLEEVKAKARDISERLLWDVFEPKNGWHRPDVITPFDVCPEPDNHTPTTWARILKPCWSAMPSICARAGKIPKVVWQNLRWRESMVKK